MMIQLIPFAVWWSEAGIAVDPPVLVEAKSHKDAAVVASIRSWSERNYHENCPNPTKYWVANMVTGSVKSIAVRIMHEATDLDASFEAGECASMAGIPDDSRHASPLDVAVAQAHHIPTAESARAFVGVRCRIGLDSRVGKRPKSWVNGAAICWAPTAGPCEVRSMNKDFFIEAGAHTIMIQVGVWIRIGPEA
jgi:hypothetical protein